MRGMGVGTQKFIVYFVFVFDAFRLWLVRAKTECRSVRAGCGVVCAGAGREADECDTAICAAAGGLLAAQSIAGEFAQQFRIPEALATTRRRESAATANFRLERLDHLDSARTGESDRCKSNSAAADADWQRTVVLHALSVEDRLAAESGDFLSASGGPARLPAPGTGCIGI